MFSINSVQPKVHYLRKESEVKNTRKACHKWPLIRLKLQVQLNDTKLTELVSFTGRKKKKTPLKRRVTRIVFGLRQFCFSVQIRNTPKMTNKS